MHSLILHELQYIKCLSLFLFPSPDGKTKELNSKFITYLEGVNPESHLNAFKLIILASHRTVT